jgi:hypothetical protein
MEEMDGTLEDREGEKKGDSRGSIEGTLNLNDLDGIEVLSTNSLS